MKTADFDSLTGRVLGAAFEVANALGAGFLEKVYERAPLRELGLRGVQAKGQVAFAVTDKATASESTSPTSWWRTFSRLS